MVEYQYIVSEYSATGEGSTVCMLITRAYPRAEDYDKQGELITTPKFRASREFIQKVGSWYSLGAENLSKDEFFVKYKSFIPIFVQRAIESEDSPGNFNFFQEIHLNYS